MGPRTRQPIMAASSESATATPVALALLMLVLQHQGVGSVPADCSGNKVPAGGACTCSASHVLQPVTGVSSWVYSDIADQCCDQVCKEEVGTTCLLARMSRTGNRKVDAACGSDTSKTLTDFIGDPSGFSAATCSDTKDGSRQMVCMCSIISTSS